MLYFGMNRIKGVYKLGERFSITFHNDCTKDTYGDCDTVKLRRSKGLDIIDKVDEYSNKRVGHIVQRTYVLVGTTRGKKEMVVYVKRYYATRVLDKPTIVFERKIELEIV